MLICKHYLKTNKNHELGICFNDRVLMYFVKQTCTRITIIELPSGVMTSQAEGRCWVLSHRHVPRIDLAPNAVDQLSSKMEDRHWFDWIWCRTSWAIWRCAVSFNVTSAGTWGGILSFSWFAVSAVKVHVTESLSRKRDEAAVHKLRWLLCPLFSIAVAVWNSSVGFPYLVDFPFWKSFHSVVLWDLHDLRPPKL